MIKTFIVSLVVLVIGSVAGFLVGKAFVPPQEILVYKTVTGVELAADLNGLIQTIQMCDASSTPETITVTFKDFGLGENSYVVSCK